MSVEIGVALCGDISITRPLANSLKQLETLEVLEDIRSADFSVGNFEIPLTESNVPLEKLLAIKSSPKFAIDAAGLGIDVLTLANNHSVDYGWQGLCDTVDNLKAQSQRVIGAGQNLEQAVCPMITEVNGTVIGVVPFSCLVPTGMAASDRRPGISPIHIHTSYEVDPYYQMEEPGDISAVQVRTRANEKDLEFALDQVRRLKEKVHVLVVSIHWGYGSGSQLAGYQQPLAHALVDAGADVIHGHHPHALHPVEFFQGKPIFYGLGTCLGQQIFLDASDQVKALWNAMSPLGLLVFVTIQDSRAETIRAKITDLNTDRLPRYLKGRELKSAANLLAEISLPYSARISLSDDTLDINPV